MSDYDNLPFLQVIIHIKPFADQHTLSDQCFLFKDARSDSLL